MLVLLLLPNSFRGMGTWWDTMKPQKRGSFPRPGPDVVERKAVAKEQTAKRVRSRTVKNEMKDVVYWTARGAAQRTLSFSNSGKIRI